MDAPLNPPVVFASTYVGSARPSAANLGYGRYGNPTWLALEQAIGALEGGRALTFASGMAAAHAVLELMPAERRHRDSRQLLSRGGRGHRSTGHRYGWAGAAGQHRRHHEVLTAADGADVVWIESPPIR